MSYNSDWELLQAEGLLKRASRRIAERIAEQDAEVDALSELLNTKDVEIVALREQVATIAELREQVRWIPVSERLPDGVVLAYYTNSLGKGRRIRAKYIHPCTEEADMESDCEFEWSEDHEMAWIKSGWYECIDNWDEYSYVAVCEVEVTCWTHLPAPPQEPTP